MQPTMLEIPTPTVDGAPRQSGALWPWRATVLVSWTLPCDDLSLLAFLAQAAGQSRIFWAHDASTPAVAGVGTAALLTAHGPDRVAQIGAQAARLFAGALHHSTTPLPAAVGPRLFGGFAFWEDHAATGPWTAFPGATFLLPRIQLTRWAGQTWLTINHLAPDDGDPAQHIRSVRAEAEMLRHSLRAAEVPGRVGMTGTVELRELVSQAQWETGVSEIVGQIRGGALRKAVLARACHLRAARPFCPTAALARLERRYGDCYRFLFEPHPGHAFFGATPELLAEVAGAALHTVALAGTARRGETVAEDEGLGAALLANPKERHEHALVVEAVAAGVRPFVRTLDVPAIPALRRLGTVQHLQTPITGQLAGAHGVLPLVAALHPTPALGGTPREAALPLIRRLETFQRGWYAAPIGWLDGRGDGLFAVAIRSAVSVGEEAWLYAGAGIVGDSNPAREWDETCLKFRPMLDALAPAAR